MADDVKPLFRPEAIRPELAKFHDLGRLANIITRCRSRLAAVVPDGRSRELHIAMVVRGRTVCLPVNPKYGECGLVDLCRRGRNVTANNGGTARG